MSVFQPGRFATNVAALSPSPAAWTPASIGAEVWFDASDLSSMKQDRTGASATVDAAVDSPVGSWLNKGTFGGWVTAPSDSARPVLRAASGLYRLDFDGVDDRLFNVSAAVGRNVSGMTAGIAALRNASTLPFRYLTVLRAAGSSRLSINWNATATTITGNNGTFGDAQVSNSYPSQALVLTGITDYANTDAFLRRNGVQVAVNTSFSTTSNTPNDAGDLYIGSIEATQYMQGSIHQVIIKETALYGTNLSSLETFLGAKAGLTI